MLILREGISLTVDELLAREQIRDVLYRYCRGVDRGDVGLLKSVYHTDALDDHGTFQGSGHDFARYIVENMDGAANGAQHHITNVLIELNLAALSAQVESYFIAFHPYTDASSSRVAFVGGRYLDRFEARAGEWKIADRRVVLDWARDDLSGNEWPAIANFRRGGRREADPSSELLETL